jgi:hypothetical protein
MLQNQNFTLAKNVTDQTRKGKGPDVNRTPIPCGMGTSEHSHGLFTKQYFEKHGEACAAGIYYALSQEIERLNKQRIEMGERPFGRPNYSSFAKYFHWFKLLGQTLPQQLDLYLRFGAIRYFL